MRKATIAIALGLVFVLALGILAKDETAKVKELSPTAIVVEKGNVSLVADFEAARLRGAEKYIPLRIYLGIQGKGRVFAERAFFTLTDPKGTKQPMATVDEIAKNYGPTLVSNDYTYYAKQSMMDYASHFNACQRLGDVAFFPNPAGPKVLYDQVEVAPYTYFSALSYFANPGGKLEGAYTLSWNDPKSGNAIDVPFAIKWDKK